VTNVISLNKDGSTPVPNETLEAGSIVVSFCTDNNVVTESLVFGGVDKDGQIRVGFMFSADETDPVKIVRLLRVRNALDQIINAML